MASGGDEGVDWGLGTEVADVRVRWRGGGPFGAGDELVRGVAGRRYWSTIASWAEAGAGEYNVGAIALDAEAGGG